MSWGKPFADAWNSATNIARAAVSDAMESMAAAADLAVDVAKAAKSAATELVNYGVDTARAVRDKAADTYNAIKERFSLWRASNVPAQACSASSQKLGDLDCQGLAQEKDMLAQAQTKAKLARAVYEKPDQQDLPDGWSRATDDDLRKLGLMDSQGKKLTEIPDSDFRADVFKGPDERYTVAFKGTTFTSLEDWKNNAQQGTGNPSDYYKRALRIADQIHANQPDNVEYVGHSLGGGLASAAAANDGSPATTFNAAGLHDQTLLRTGIVPNPDNIDAYYVEGDILSTGQDFSLGVAPTAAGERFSLSPADSITWGDAGVGVLAGALNPVFGVVAALGVRGGRLHLMDSVDDALAKRMGQIDLLRKYKGCK